MARRITREYLFLVETTHLLVRHICCFSHYPFICMLLLKVHNVRKICVQHNNKGMLTMVTVRGYTDDTTRFQELGIEACQIDWGHGIHAASNCLVDNDLGICMNGILNREGSWWELNLGQDIAVYKVEILLFRTLPQDSSIYLLDSNDIILATAQTGEYRFPC